MVTDVNAEELLPVLQQQLGSLMVEICALRAALAKAQRTERRDNEPETG